MTFILPSFGASAIAAVPGGSFANDFSISLDGTNDYLDCGNLTSINGATNLSISLWFKLDNLTSGGVRPVLMVGGGSGSFYIYPNADTTLTYVTGTVAHSFTVSTWNTGQWYHLTTVHAGTSLEVYLDGSSIGTATVSAVASNQGNNLNIGRWSNGVGSVGNYTDGQIDEVALFTSALSSSDVTAIYNGGNGPTDISSLSPKHWWRMGDSDTGVSNGSSTPTIVSNVANSSAIKDHYALDFDGTNNYLSMGTSAISLDTNFTISAWFKPGTDALAGYDLIGGWGNASAGQARMMQILNSKLSFEIYLSRISGATTLSANTWYHGAVTFSGNNVEIFLNGSSDGTGTLSRSTMTSSETFIGGSAAMSAVGWQPFLGLIDEFAVFNSVLSATNISDIYNSGVPTDLGTNGLNLNPQGWWRMGDGGTWDGSNWSIPDASNNSNVGTTVNMFEADRVTDTPTANAILTNGPTYSDNVPT